MTTNTLHQKNLQALSVHHDTLMVSLARRIQVAKAANNDHLVELLEQERQQIKAASGMRKDAQSLAAWLNNLSQRVANALFGGSELQASEFVSGSDRWWYAFDPRTGECVYADSEAELRLWIKENYSGK